MFTVFKNNAPWIWENLDGHTIDCLLKEHSELHKDPQEKQEEEMNQKLERLTSTNSLVKAFMDGSYSLDSKEKKV